MGMTYGSGSGAGSLAKKVLPVPKEPTAIPLPPLACCQTWLLADELAIAVPEPSKAKDPEISIGTAMLIPPSELEVSAPSSK